MAHSTRAVLGGLLGRTLLAFGLRDSTSDPYRSLTAPILGTITGQIRSSPPAFSSQTGYGAFSTLMSQVMRSPSTFTIFMCATYWTLRGPVK